MSKDNDVKIYKFNPPQIDDKEPSENNKNIDLTFFDIEDGYSYFDLINVLSEDVDWTKIGYIDPRRMDWDIDFLRAITRTIENNHHAELVKYNSRYCPLDVTGDLISTTLEYVLVNKRYEVGKDELINVFKYWNYLPFNICLDVLDSLFKEYDIPYSKHPFGIKEPRKKEVQKVIQFPKTKPKED